MSAEVKGDALVFDERGADEGVRPYTARLTHSIYFAQTKFAASLVSPVALYLADSG
jgi:hypothetical protein